MATVTRTLEAASDRFPNAFVDLEDFSAVESIVDIHQSRRSIFQSDQCDFDEERDGRLSDGKRRM